MTYRISIEGWWPYYCLQPPTAELADYEADFTEAEDKQIRDAEAAFRAAQELIKSKCVKAPEAGR